MRYGGKDPHFTQSYSDGPGFVIFKELGPGVAQNSVREVKSPGFFFTSHKNTAFLAIRTNILTLPQWGETSFNRHELKE
jgi:hypothetical protein